MKAIRRHGESFLSPTVLRPARADNVCTSGSEAKFRPDVMKAVISKHAFAYSIVLVVLLCAIDAVLAQPRKSLTLNETAFAFAAQLIKEEHFVADGKGAWSEHRRSPDEENDFIRLHGFGEYAKWHLGIDERFSAKTKRRYKFLRRQSADTSFLTAILKTSIAAVYSPQRAGPLNTDIMTLNMQQHS